MNTMNMDTTIGDLLTRALARPAEIPATRECVERVGPKDGDAVLIRTVTHYLTGRIAAQDDLMIELADAAWIADTGRFADALATGTVNEVEPFPGTAWVARGAVVDIAPWGHDLPRTQL